MEITEKELILNRAGHFDSSQDRVATMTICPKHRRDLTVDWRGRKGPIVNYVPGGGGGGGGFQKSVVFQN